MHPTGRPIFVLTSTGVTDYSAPNLADRVHRRIVGTVSAVSYPDSLLPLKCEWTAPPRHSAAQVRTILVARITRQGAGGTDPFSSSGGPTNVSSHRGITPLFFLSISGNRRTDSHRSECPPLMRNRYSQAMLRKSPANFTVVRLCCVSFLREISGGAGSARHSQLRARGLSRS
jgi:hypothetical protein